MEKLPMQSRDRAEGSVAMVARLWPHCVTEAKDPGGGTRLRIDFDKLRAELTAHDPEAVIGEGEERYQFTWPDKRAAAHLANTPTTMTLRPVREASVDFDSTENLYIEGDNLDVLKCLRENYLNAVKMIYIDPPYNTGKDFVYPDDLSQSQQEFLESCKVYDEEGNLTFEPKANTETEGKFHTNWCNMMYPRLKVCFDLLASDGILFISVDDKEVDNARKMCDEIFGFRNRVDRGSMVWVNRGSSKGFLKIVKNHEFILAYSKDAETVRSQYGENFWDDLEAIEHYCFNKPSKKNPISDVVFEKGCKITGISDITFSGRIGKEVTLEIISGVMEFRDGELQNDVTLRGSFPYVNQIREFFSNRKKGLATFDNKGQKWVEIFFNSNGMPRYRKDRNTEVISSVIDEQGIPNYGSNDIAELLGKKEIFEFPKPKELLIHLLSYFVPKEGVVLDIFSGSASTAHAVMEFNAQTQGKRKFIMVQLPALTPEKSEARKAGYNTICEIGEERIRRAGRKVKEEAGLQGQDLDIGFRVLRLDTSNMEDVYYKPEDFDPSKIEGLVDNIKPDRTEEDLLFHVMPQLNAPLSARIEVREIAGKKVYIVGEGYIAATFDRNVNETTIKEIARLRPVYFVMRDASAATDNVLDNFEQLFRHYSPETVCKVI